MRLKAFTLLELLVGMIATGIVIAAVFSAYHIVGRQTLNYQESSNSVTELSLLHSRLILDFNKSTHVQKTTSTLLLFGSSTVPLHAGGLGGEEAGIAYDFESDYVLRKHNEHIDTFFVSVKIVNAFANGILSMDEGTHIDEVRLTLFDSGTEIRLRKPVEAYVEMQEEFVRIQEMK